MKDIKKDIFSNSLFYVIKSIIGLIIPLISFPIITRVLGPENYGRVSYANSIANYFIYFAALGISTYAVREGAKYKESPQKLGKLYKEILLINIFSSIFAYIGILILLQFEQFKDYSLLILIHSFIIIFQTFGIEWLFQVKEDYKYISIRHIIFQIIGILFLIFFLKDKNDYLIYAIYTVFTTCADGIINIFRKHKYIKIDKNEKLEIKKHIRPLLSIFSISIVSTIYQNIDTTMLGLILTNIDVGFYNSALKIYNIISTIVSSISVVMFSRVSFIATKSEEDFQNIIYQFSKFLFLLSIPMTIGLILTGDILIDIFCGEEYQSSSLVLKIYSINILLSTINRIFGHQILLSKNEENKYFLATSISCAINIMINLILIKDIGIVACAISSIIGVLISDIIIMYFSKKYISIKKIICLIIKPLIISPTFIFVNYVVRLLMQNLYLQLIIIILLCVLIYLICVILLYRQDIKTIFKRR